MLQLCKEKLDIFGFLYAPFPPGKLLFVVETHTWNIQHLKNVIIWKQLKRGLWAFHNALIEDAHMRFAHQDVRYGQKSLNLVQVYKLVEFEW